MANIVPSILTGDVADAQTQLDRLSGLVEWVQIDFMDGQFVPTVSITPAEANELDTDIQLEAHLMVNDPAAFWQKLDPELFRRVYFHVEAMADPEDMIKDMREAELLVGLANRLETPIDDFEDYVDMVDNVLFMSVVPGQQGRAFHSEVLEKIRAFINQFPDHQIAIDGGITMESIGALKQIGIDDIGVGSLIRHSDDPAKTIDLLLDQLS